MKALIPMDPYGIFVDTHDTARADSRLVAEFFEKDHNHVLRDIRKLVDPQTVMSQGFRLSNFGQSSYVNEQGKRMPCYAMTRDGFTMLDMLQTVDMGLLLAVPDYQQRKRHLEWYAQANAGSFGTTRESVAPLARKGEVEQE